jgi:hypothetical protein
MRAQHHSVLGCAPRYDEAVVKQRRGSHQRRRIDEPAAQRELVDRLAHELGIGVLVASIEDGPPWRITAHLTFGLLQTEVRVEGPDEAAAWRELARAAASWRQSNEVSLSRSWWGG